MVVTVETSTIISPDIRDAIEYALQPDVGKGIGTRVTQTPIDVSDGVEFEVGAGGVYIGCVPYNGDTGIDFEYSAPTAADALLYVYVADLEQHKEWTNGDTTAKYAALQYESEYFRALSRELATIIDEVFQVDDIRLERYPTDEAGVYYVQPLPP